MSSDTSIKTTDGNIQLESNTGNIRLEYIDAGFGDVRVISLAGNILDCDMADDNEIDIQSSGLTLSSANGIGSGNNHIETDVEYLTANTGINDIFIRENNDITIYSMTINNQFDVFENDINNGSIVLITQDGTITINNDSEKENNGISAANNILLQADGISDINLNADINSKAGHITIIAQNNISQVLESNIQTTTGDIYIEAISGAINMNDTSKVDSGDGNIRMIADKNIQISSIHANKAALFSNNNIKDNSYFNIDIEANSLKMSAQKV